MPIGILKYNLEESHEQLAFKRANSATDAYLVLWDMEQELRRLIKYEPLNADGSTQYNTETLEYIREFMSNTLDKYGVSMGDLE